jgi:hypothetical protein
MRGTGLPFLGDLSAYYDRADRACLGPGGEETKPQFPAGTKPRG